MRTDQMFGLTKEAKKWLDENCRIVPDQTCPNCHWVISTKKECKQYVILDGAFGNKFPLMEYSLKDGGVVCEILQCDPWMSGPCFFLCLKIKGKNGYPYNNGTMGVIFKWTSEEIRKASSIII